MEKRNQKEKRRVVVKARLNRRGQAGPSWRAGMTHA